MRALFQILFLCLATSAFGASPSFDSFNTDDFTVSAFRIRVNTNRFPAGGSSGSGVSVSAGSNTSATTNSGVVTIASDVSHTEVTNVANALALAATNTLDTVLRALIALYYPLSNPSNFVTATVTNLLQGALGFQPATNAAVVATNFTISTTSPLAGGGALNANLTLTIQAASGSQAGALSAADWVTFNAKMAATYAALSNVAGFLIATNGGNIAASQLPAFTGDVTTSAGSSATTMKNTGTAGTYRSVTFDAQGRETSGSNPTTFAGYGLSDSSANLASAVTDETGLGGLVFSNSPTLNTPTLTIPVIASFASATHGHTTTATGGTLDAAAIASGTVSAARLPGLETAYPAAVTNNDTRALTLTNTLTTGLIKASNGSSLSSLSVGPQSNVAGWEDFANSRVAIGYDGNVAMLATASKAFVFDPGATMATFGTVSSKVKFDTSGNGFFMGNVTATNAFASYLNNTAAPTSITVGASVFNYTNTTGHDIHVSVDANGATLAMSYNGTTIYTSLASGGDHEVYMPPLSRIGVTYSIATPIMYYWP